MLDPMSLEGMFAQYGRSLLWAFKKSYDKTIIHISKKR